MFETQKSGNKTSSREIGLNIWTKISHKVGQYQVSRGVSILCWQTLLEQIIYFRNILSRIISSYTKARIFIWTANDFHKSKKTWVEEWLQMYS